LDKLHVTAGHLQIRSLAFFFHDPPDYVELTQLFNVAIATMDAMTELQESFQISQHCPDYILQAVTLAACTLIKLLKSYPTETLGETDGTRALFSAISFCREASAVNDDIPSRVAHILSQLWSSEKIYKDSEGNYIRSLLVRNRLTASVVFDSICWWRKLNRGWLNAQPIHSNWTDRIKEAEKGVAAEDPAVVSAQLNQLDNSNSLGLPFLDDTWNWDIDWGAMGPMSGIA
jgi:hypothetical protein